MLYRVVVPLSVLITVVSGCGMLPTPEAAEPAPEAVEAEEAPATAVESDEVETTEPEEADTQDATAVPEGVTFDLEPITRVAYEQLDDAFNYEAWVGEVSHGTSVSDFVFVAESDLDIDAVRVEAFTFDGDPLGEVTVEGVELLDRFVLRWDDAVFGTPYVGVATSSNGGSSRLVMGLRDSPHVIGADPANIDVVLFGAGIEREDPQPGQSPTTAPFAFEDDTVIEHGPYTELPLP